MNDLTDPQEIARRNFSIIQARNQFLRERETIIPDEDLNNELQRIRSRIRYLEERRNNLLQQEEYILHNRSTGTGKKTKKNRKKKGGGIKKSDDPLRQDDVIRKNFYNYNRLQAADTLLEFAKEPRIGVNKRSNNDYQNEEFKKQLKRRSTSPTLQELRKSIEEQDKQN